MKETCIYNFLEYVQTEQQIYGKPICSLYFVDRLCISTWARFWFPFFNSNFKFVSGILLFYMCCYNFPNLRTEISNTLRTMINNNLNF